MKSAPVLVEPLTVTAQLVHVEPGGAAPVTLVVQPLGGVSAEAFAALGLPVGPAALLTWSTRSDLGHESRGAVLLRPESSALDLFFDSGLSQMQAAACARVLAGLLTWEEG